LQYDKCLFFQPSLTGFSFSEEVCVYAFARDDFDSLAHLTHEWEAGQLFYSPLELAQEAEYIDHRIDLIRDYLPTIVTRDDRLGLYTFVLGNRDNSIKKKKKNEPSNEDILHWLNTWWEQKRNNIDGVESRTITRTLCEYFYIYHQKRLACKPGLTGFSFPTS
jgi:hypothetical protein